jgi:hypothetical protein
MYTFSHKKKRLYGEKLSCAFLFECCLSHKEFMVKKTAVGGYSHRFKNLTSPYILTASTNMSSNKVMVFPVSQRKSSALPPIDARYRLTPI